MPLQQTKCYQSADFSFGEAGVNISDMVSKSRGEYAYAMFDVEAPVSDEFEKKLEAMENIIRIRIL